MKRKAYLYSEANDDYKRGGHKLTSREKSMAKHRDITDFKAGKLRKASRKTYMEDD